MATMLPTDLAPATLRAQLERQLQAVAGMLDDGDLDALLTLAVDRFVSPAPTPTLPDSVELHQVEASLVARHGWLLGVIVRDATAHAVAWRWWAGGAAGVALSDA